MTQRAPKEIIAWCSWQSPVWINFSRAFCCVLKLTLHALGCDWQFEPTAGGKFRDSGSAKCSPLPSSKGREK
ncbi:MAG: hypothetical protein ABIP88_03380 [Candidatus Binatia bacterium]